MSTQLQDLAETYQQKTDIEHILDAPDTYIGSVESDRAQNWVLTEDDKMRFKSYEWIGGLYKCFDEGIVNCRDHFVRLQQKIINKAKKFLEKYSLKDTVELISNIEDTNKKKIYDICLKIKNEENN